MELSGKFRDLAAWRESYSLALDLYKATVDFPKAEQYGLAQQIRRAAVSVPSNIAEGWGRNTTTDYLRFLAMARGSLYELQTHVSLAGDLSYIKQSSSFEDRINQIERILNGLIRSLQQKAGAEHLHHSTPETRV